VVVMSTHSANFPIGGSGHAPRSMVRRIIDFQVRLSAAHDRLLATELTLDGNQDFKLRLVPEHLRQGMVVYDVGGGKHPSVSRERKLDLGLRVVGLDISAAELDAAPAGCYDERVRADITLYQGRGDGDLAICDALLEHVRDTGAALAGMASMLRSGGRALLFVPSRYAAYAALNRMLPQSWKRRLLFRIFPGSVGAQGFPAFYDRCTPAAIAALAERNGFAVELVRTYFHSTYFTFCLPLHAAWRAWQRLFRLTMGDRAAETFSVVLRKLE